MKYLINKAMYDQKTILDDKGLVYVVLGLVK